VRSAHRTIRPIAPSPAAASPAGKGKNLSQSCRWQALKQLLQGDGIKGLHQVEELSWPGFLSGTEGGAPTAAVGVRSVKKELNCLPAAVVAKRPVVARPSSLSLAG